MSQPAPSNWKALFTSGGTIRTFMEQGEKMDSISKIYLKQRSGREKDFGRSVRSLVYGLWRGELDLFTFIDTMVFTLERNLTQAWYEGAAQCGVKSSELTEAETNARRDFIANQYAYLLGFADAVNKGSKANKGKLGPLIERSDLWVGRYAEAKYAGMQMACKDKKLKFVRGPTSDPCEDCIGFDGKVYRASTWLAANIRPRARNLKCRGYKCLCKFVVTDDPITPGSPPSLSG